MVGSTWRWDSYMYLRWSPQNGETVDSHSLNCEVWVFGGSLQASPVFSTGTIALCSVMACLVLEFINGKVYKTESG